MAVTSEPVVIRVEVQDSSGAALAGTTKNLEQLGAAGSQAGAQAAAGLQRAGAAAHEAGGHFQTSFDQVRLLRTELGVQMPRAMESMIARSQALMGVIQGLGGVLAGVGFAMIGMSLAKELSNVYERWLDIGAAARGYQEEMQKTKASDYIDTHSIETATERFNEATDAAKTYGDLVGAMKSQALLNLAMGNPGSAFNFWQGARDSAEGQTEEQRNADKLKRLKIDAGAHELNLLQIEADHARDARLTGQRKIDAEQAKRDQIAAENRKFSVIQDKALGNPTPADAGAARERAEDAIAAGNADAERFNLEKQRAQELRHLREEALESELHGSALYRAQESAAIADLKGTDKDSVDFRNAIHEKFHNEEMMRLREEQTQVAQRAREAGGAGLTGVEKIQYEGQTRDQAILAKAGAHGYQSLNDAQADRVSNWKQTNAEILASEQAFTEKVNQLVDASDEHQISGFARIRAEAKKQIDAWTADYAKEYGDPTKAAYIDHLPELNRSIGAINAGADQQTADLARKNAEETEQIEAQARIKLLSGEKQKTAAIDAEYEERVRKYQEALDQQEISQDDFNRRVAAAQIEAQAEMRQQAQETAQKIAGEMSGLFGAHPLEALEHMGQKYASDATAALLTRAMGGNPLQGGAGTGSLASTGLGAVFTHLAGGPHGAPGGLPSFAPHLTASAPSSIAQAAIHVEQGAIYFSGGAGGHSGTARGFLPGGPNALPAGLPGGFGGGSTGHPGFAGGGFGSSTAGPFGVSMGSVPSGGGGGGVFDAAASTPVGSAPAPGAGVLGYANTAMQGIGTAHSIYDMVMQGRMGASTLQTSTLDRSGGFNPDGTYNPGGSPASPTAWQSSMMGGGPNAANTIGAATAGVGLYSAYKQGGAGGMMGGAMSGAQMGMEVGGPWGAAVGAAAGLAVGFFGGGEQARVWWLKNGQPRLANDMDGFQHGTTDYLSAVMDMQALGQEAKQTLDKMGFTGSQYYGNHAQPEIENAIDKLNREQKAGRSAATFSGAQYDIGSPWIPEDHVAKVHRGERIFSADHNERMTRAFEGAMSARSSDAPRMAAAQAPPSQVHLHVHAIDAKSSVDFLMDNADAVRSALNKTYGDYGGLADVSA